MAMLGKNDQLLQKRMKELDIDSWRALQQKSGLNFSSLRLVRCGSVGKLKIEQLQGLAIALQWEWEYALHILNVLSIDKKKKNVKKIIELQTEDTEKVDRAEKIQDDGLEQQRRELLADFRSTSFEQMHTLLTSYPTLRQIVAVKPELPAKNLISLFTSLDNLMDSWGYKTIGSVWEKVAYDPKWHQGDVEDITPGELVYIRFVGYQDGDRVICPAKVSRTLPLGN